jgi:hypothetical protein
MLRLCYFSADTGVAGACKHTYFINHLVLQGVYAVVGLVQHGSFHQLQAGMPPASKEAERSASQVRLCVQPCLLLLTAARTCTALARVSLTTSKEQTQWS